LADFGHVRHGYIGVVVGPELGDSNDPLVTRPGLVVTGVSPGGPAAEAGVRVNDRILGLDGRPLSGLDELSRAVEAAPIGQEFRLDLDRAGKRLEIVVKSRPRPDSLRPFPGTSGASGTLAPRGPAGSRAGRTSPNGAPPTGGPVLRSESQEDRKATKPAPSSDRKAAESEPAPKADPTLVPR
jgi:membrane-associated protease RseP (regulator of RpoE activity)